MREQLPHRPSCLRRIWQAALRRWKAITQNLSVFQNYFMLVAVRLRHSSLPIMLRDRLSKAKLLKSRSPRLCSSASTAQPYQRTRLIPGMVMFYKRVATMRAWHTSAAAHWSQSMQVQKHPGAQDLTLQNPQQVRARSCSSAKKLRRKNCGEKIAQKLARADLRKSRGIDLLVGQQDFRRPTDLPSACALILIAHGRLKG